jgi:MFS family permease
MAVLSFALSAFSSPVANLALIRLENGLAWSTGAASLMLVLSSTPGVILGLLIGGRLADTVGRRPTQAVAIGVGVVGGVAFYSVEGWLLSVAMFLATFGGSAFAPAYASHRSELFPTEIRSTAAAWLVNAAIAGGLIGFAAGRFAVDAWGLSVTIGVLGATLAIAATALIGLPETKGLTIHKPAAGTEPPTGATPV